MDSGFIIDQLIVEVLSWKLRWDERMQLLVLLRLLSSGPGTALLCASGSVFRPFASRSAEERERLLLRLGTSPLELHRRAFNGLKRLCLSVAASAIVAPKQGGAPPTNPLWELAGYPGGAPVRDLPPAARVAAFEAFEAFDAAATDATRVVECDVVIVGSGAGGGVAAAILAVAGLHVVVLEKGGYVPPEALEGNEIDGFGKLYEKGALLTTDDGAIPILAGATLGGGTTINWACCLPPPEIVRKEWADEHGLDQFAPGATAFDASLRAVLARIGATAGRPVVHNKANALLLEGSAALGYKGYTAQQNLRDTAARSAGWTCFGDRAANKQGTLATYLPDAVDHGARVLTNCYVDRVLFGGGEGGGAARRATGVRVVPTPPAVGGGGEGASSAAAVCGGAPFEVRARRAVVLSAGSLHSPCVLLRSRVGGAHVGRHLRLHPVTAVTARFAEPVRMYEGAPMTAVCGEAETCPAGTGYGAKIEIPSAHPGLMAAALGWRGGAPFSEAIGQINHTVAAIALQRDGGAEGGRVTLDAARTGPHVWYRLRAADAASMLAALEKAARALVAAGAEQLATLHTGLPDHEVRKVHARQGMPGANPPLDEWLESVKAAGLPRNGVGIFSAHQMGTCRMGTDVASSVVDPNGEVWDADGLFVMDASVFPTASGANPMVTTLAIAHLLATRLAERLVAGKDGAAEDAGAGAAERATKQRALARSARLRRCQSACALAVITVAFAALVVPLVVSGEHSLFL